MDIEFLVTTYEAQCWRILMSRKLLILLVRKVLHILLCVIIYFKFLLINLRSLSIFLKLFNYSLVFKNHQNSIL